ncbi:hypothetical protein J3R83DRAFT_1747 [Lanmaoa asiatica]|nr:hypothetical protein J3R83DRAFT_1747 [Lanmaoa asiatica]
MDSQTLAFILALPPALSPITSVDEEWCVWHITLLLLATVVLADYHIDNANMSVLYSMALASQLPGQPSGWETLSMNTQSLELQWSNATGNYTVPLDASNCYDENYTLGVCGSGITMYVFNAGFSGMTASFSVDGGAAVSNMTQAPPPPNYQVSNVSLYNLQGLPSGNHAMKMTILDWNGSSTHMKFDYAYVNESFVAIPATTSSTTSMTSMTKSTLTSQVTSQVPIQTSMGNSSTSNQINLGGVIGGTLGGVAILASSVISSFYFRKRKAMRSPEPTFQANLFASEHFSSPTPPIAPYAPQRLFFAQHPEVATPLSRSRVSSLSGLE